MGAIAVTEEALLLVRRDRAPEAGRWSLPGGRVEAGETLAEAVVREVAEETGLSVRCGRFVGWVERFGPGYHFVILDFAVTVLGGTLAAGDDAREVRWVPLGELGSISLVTGLEAFLRDHDVVPGAAGR